MYNQFRTFNGKIIASGRFIFSLEYRIADLDIFGAFKRQYLSKKLSSFFFILSTFFAKSSFLKDLA